MPGGVEQTGQAYTRGRIKKLIDFARTVIDKPSCEDCREMHENEGAPPCEQPKELSQGEEFAPRCEWGVPDVMPGNVEAVRIWFKCRKQIIAGPGGPIDINDLAVKMYMDLYSVRDQRTCLEKVKVLSESYWSVVMERERAKSKD